MKVMIDILDKFSESACGVKRVRGVYVIEYKNGLLYVGATGNLQMRFSSWNKRMKYECVGFHYREMDDRTIRDVCSLEVELINHFGDRCINKKRTYDNKLSGVGAKWKKEKKPKLEAIVGIRKKVTIGKRDAKMEKEVQAYADDYHQGNFSQAMKALAIIGLRAQREKQQ